MFKFPAVYLLTALCALIVTPAQARPQTFVASYGNDANPCGRNLPCRQFTKAVGETDTNGEVVVLDSANYLPVTITKSISLTVAPGAYAGIAVFQNDVSGVTIATPGVNVVLRGLTINGLGGDNGIVMNSNGNLSIENCVISNLAVGINAGSGAVVRIIKTLFRNNQFGVDLGWGVTTADISRSKFLGNSIGIIVRVDSVVTISDTIMTGGGGGIDVSTGFGFVTGDPRVNVIRSTISNHGTAIRASAYTKTASVTLSGSMVTGNVNGFELSGNGSLMSRGNNTITDNGSNTGTLTPLAPI